MVSPGSQFSPFTLQTKGGGSRFMINPKRLAGSVPLAGLLITVFVLACFPQPLAAQEFPNLDKKTAEEVLPKKPYSPKVNENYPTRVFWGDTHLHTSQSVDAVLFGTTLGPEEASRNANGVRSTRRSVGLLP